MRTKLPALAIGALLLASPAFGFDDTLPADSTRAFDDMLPDLGWGHAQDDGLTFSLFDFADADNLPSVERLPAAMTINGTTVYPSLRYRGADATSTTWPAWGYGNILAIAGSGSAPTLDQPSVLIGDGDSVVNINSGKYYADAGTELGDIGTEDFVLELLAPTSKTYGGIYGKGGHGTVGWFALYASSAQPLVGIDDGPNNDSRYTSAGNTEQWVYVLVFVDRDENSANGVGVYTNGVEYTTDNWSAVGTLTNTDNFVLGSAVYAGSRRVGTARLGMVAMYKRAGWFPGGASNPTAWAAIASDRFQRLTGFWPSKAKGTDEWQVYTRSTSAYVDIDQGDGTTDLLLVGPEWPRVAEREGTIGYLPEPQATNLALQSQTLGTTWTQIDAGDSIGDNATAAPDGTATADSLIADATDGPHGLTQGVNLTDATYALSVYAKAGNQGWLYLSDDTVANATGYFNLTACAAGTSGAGATSHVMDYGNGWCRCAIVYTGTVAAHTHRLASAEADDDSLFAGDGAAVNTYLWGAQVEARVYPTSYILTVAASVTRTKDQLRYVAGDNIGGEDRGKGTIVATVLCPDYKMPVTNYIVSLSDNGSAGEDIRLGIYPTADTAFAQMYHSWSLQGTVIGTTDIVDGAAHVLRTAWGADDLRLWVAGSAEGTPDTSATVPDDLDQLRIGSDQAGAYQPACLITDVKIYSKAVEP